MDGKCSIFTSFEQPVNLLSNVKSSEFLAQQFITYCRDIISDGLFFRQPSFFSIRLNSELKRFAPCIYPFCLKSQHDCNYKASDNIDFLSLSMLLLCIELDGLDIFHGMAVVITTDRLVCVPFQTVDFFMRKIFLGEKSARENFIF